MREGWVSFGVPVLVFVLFVGAPGIFVTSSVSASIGCEAGLENTYLSQLERHRWGEVFTTSDGPIEVLRTPGVRIRRGGDSFPLRSYPSRIHPNARIRAAAEGEPPDYAVPEGIGSSTFHRVSLDGRVVVGALNRDLRIWDSENGQLLGELSIVPNPELFPEIRVREIALGSDEHFELIIVVFGISAPATMERAIFRSEIRIPDLLTWTRDWMSGGEPAEVIRFLSTNMRAKAIAVHPQGERVVVLDYVGRLLQRNPDSLNTSGSVLVQTILPLAERTDQMEWWQNRLIVLEPDLHLRVFEFEREILRETRRFRIPGIHPSQVRRPPSLTVLPSGEELVLRVTIEPQQTGQKRRLDLNLGFNDAGELQISHH